MSAPLPIVLTRVATARTRRVGSVGIPRRVSRSVSAAVVIAVQYISTSRYFLGCGSVVRRVERDTPEGRKSAEEFGEKALREGRRRAYKYPHATGSPEAD